MARQAEKAGLPLTPSSTQDLDHGALVPLWFLQQAGFKGRVAVFGFPWESAPGDVRRFGEALTAAMTGLDRTWALVASGEMSHALHEGAPAGFQPLAHTFDEAVVACVQAGTARRCCPPGRHLRNLAAEDVVESLDDGGRQPRGRSQGPAVPLLRSPLRRGLPGGRAPGSRVVTFPVARWWHLDERGRVVCELCPRACTLAGRPVGVLRGSLR